ncbi:M20 family metallopeptidase [Chloroflexota bacterium]
MDIEELKALVIGEVASHHQQLSELSLKIHSNPETSSQETKAATWLTQSLEDNGFIIQHNYCGLPTAFKASYGDGKPIIAVLAEYDALPELGHACGHNLIATSAVGAGIASIPVIKQLGGSITVIGTPAEELHGGKVTMVERGGFKNIDIAMIIHPGVMNQAITEALACVGLKVEFFGKAAHAASSPESGINALEAMLLSFTAINSLRQHINEKARIHGIITHGGKAVNVVPAYSSAIFLVRAEDDNYLYQLQQRVLDCFIGAATATGSRLEYKWAKVRYASMRNNLILAGLFSRNMRSLGRIMQPLTSSMFLGSTDMGNVSLVVPSIHSFFAIAPPRSTNTYSGIHRGSSVGRGKPWSSRCSQSHGYDRC